MAFGRPAYVPPSGLAPADLNELWLRLSRAEGGRLDSLRENLKNVKENLRKWFANLANAFGLWVSDQQAAVNTVSGELEDQAAQLDQIEVRGRGAPLPLFRAGRARALRPPPPPQAQLADGTRQLAGLAEANSRLVDAGIHDNMYTEFTVDELTLLYGEAQAVLQNKRQLVDNLLARKREKERCVPPP
jgi:hypothetical protein